MRIPNIKFLQMKTMLFPCTKCGKKFKDGTMVTYTSLEPGLYEWDAINFCWECFHKFKKKHTPGGVK